MNGVVNILAL